MAWPPFSQSLVVAGCLRVYFNENDGSDRVLYFAPEGWCVLGSAVVGRAVSPDVHVEALEASEVWSIHLPQAGAASRRGAKVWTALAESTQMRVERRLIGALRKGAAERYLEFRGLYPGLENRIAQYHIASYLGVSPEFFSKLRKQMLRVVS